MKWRGQRRSDNVEDRRGVRGGGRTAVAGGGGLIAVLLIAASLFFPDAVPFLRMIQDAGGGGQSQSQPQSAPIDDETRAFTETTLAFTEDTWRELFAAGAFGQAAQYQEPVLVLFSGQTTSPCGVASAQSGPFYCPADRKIYIDPAFYQVMERQLRASGDFAQAYVLAHEVAHHVQNLIGVLPEVNQLRARSSELEGNRLTVRLELQADCLAGVWAQRLQAQYAALERGDLEEALGAAHAVGDDILQRMSGRRVDTSQFTHGSAEQRVRWFQTGFEAGRPAVCDTFQQAYERL